MIFKRKLLGILLTACMIAGLFGQMLTTASAADPATLSVSGGSCEVGHSCEVKVKVSAPDAIGIVQFTLTYDTDLLECEGYSGKIQELDTDIKDKSKTYTYKFRGKKEGTASLKLSGVEILPLNGGDAFEGGVKTSDGSVTVKPAYVASSNAYLKSLSVEEGKISPSFAKETYEYSMELDGKYSKVSVSAKAEDDKAKVSVSGNKDLKEGKNTVSITVTAEDGSTKKYKITVNRGPAPTSTPTPTPSPSATPTPGLTVHVGEQDLTLLDEITAELPEGFVSEGTDVGGYHVAVAGSENEDTKLVQLSDGKLYVFSVDDAGTVQCYPLQTVSGTARLYRYLPTPEDVEVPVGFAESETDVFGERLTVYRSENEKDLVLAYLRSPEGTEGWYLVDLSEHTVQRYSDELYSVAPTETVTPTPEITDEPEPTETPGDGGDNKELPTLTPANPSGDTNAAPVRNTASGGGFWKLIENLSKRERIGVAIIGVLFFISVLLLVLLLISHNRNAKEYDAEEVDDQGTTFDPKLLDREAARKAEARKAEAKKAEARKAQTDKAYDAMRDAEAAERKAKKSVDEARKAYDEYEAGVKKSKETVKAAKEASKAAAATTAKEAAKASKDSGKVKPKAETEKPAEKPKTKKIIEDYDDYDEEDYL